MKNEPKKSLHAVGKRGRGNAPSEAPYRSQAERRGEGKALRDTVPRAEHSGWKPPKDRPSPVDIVVAGNEGRQQHLVPLRMARMSASPFAFLRGAAAVMAWDLSHTPVTGIFLNSPPMSAPIPTAS